MTNENVVKRIQQCQNCRVAWKDCDPYKCFGKEDEEQFLLWAELPPTPEEQKLIDRAEEEMDGGPDYIDWEDDNPEGVYHTHVCHGDAGCICRDEDELPDWMC